MRFLARYDGEVSEPLVGRQGSRVSMLLAYLSANKILVFAEVVECVNSGLNGA